MITKITATATDFSMNILKNGKETPVTREMISNTLTKLAQNKTQLAQKGLQAA